MTWYTSILSSPALSDRSIGGHARGRCDLYCRSVHLWSRPPLSAPISIRVALPPVCRIERYVRSFVLSEQRRENGVSKFHEGRTTTEGALKPGNSFPLHRAGAGEPSHFTCRRQSPEEKSFHNGRPRGGGSQLHDGESTARCSGGGSGNVIEQGVPDATAAFFAGCGCFSNDALS